MTELQATNLQESAQEMYDNGATIGEIEERLSVSVIVEDGTVYVF